MSQIPASIHRLGPRLVLMVCALALMSLATVRADELLSNADFSQGQDGWGGDVQDAGAADANPLAAAPGSSGGVTVNLNQDQEARIYQSFHTLASDADSTVAFSLAPGSKFTGTLQVSRIADIEVPSTSKNYDTYNASYPVPVVIIENRDANEIAVYPLTVEMRDGAPFWKMPARVHSDADEKIFLAFPPGEGTVTVTKVSLASVAD